jgi:hypothetical protein
MGAGVNAHKMSAMTLGLIENFYKAGFDNEIILESVNKLLAVNNQENYSTLDVCLLDLNNQIADFDFLAKSLYSLTLSTKGYLEFYYNNDYFLLIPDNPNQCLIKWTLASEEIHNLYDEKWKSACADVYEYNKGDIYE